MARQPTWRANCLADIAVPEPLVGFLRHPRRAFSPPAHMQAPTAEAAENHGNIRQIASEVLPGVHMRRRLFWRYTAHYATMAANRGRQNPNTTQLDTAVFPAFFGSARFVGRLVQPLVSSHDLLSSQGQVGWRVTPNVSPPQRVSGDGGGSVLVSLSLQRSR